jgi:hypothetical protein
MEALTLPGRRDDLVAKRRWAGERVVGDGVGLWRE